MMISLRSLSLLTVGLVAATAHAADYKVDTAHSRVGFSVKHMMISTVRGHFKDFTGDFYFDAAKDEVKNANFTVEAGSIDTDNPKRDEHLKSPDFFDVAKYPTITIKNSKIKKTGKDKYSWTGDLTMHGVTKPVTFNLEYTGSVKGMEGANHAGFNAEGKIDRKDFGLKWNKALEAGGVAVGDEVTINIDVEAVEQKGEPSKEQKADASGPKKK